MVNTRPEQRRCKACPLNNHIGPYLAKENQHKNQCVTSSMCGMFRCGKGGCPFGQERLTGIGEGHQTRPTTADEKAKDPGIH